MLTYLLTPGFTVLLEKLTGLQLVKKLPAFHGTWMFITALTSVRHLSLSWANPIQSIYPHPNFLQIHPNIIHPSMPRSPQWSLSLRFPQQYPVHPLSTPIPATCPAHLILLYLITRYAVSSIPPLSRPSQFQTFSSTPCSVLKHPQLPFLR